MDLKKVIGENIIDKEERIVNITEEIKFVGIYFSGKW
jgi:hypothetical protein